MQSVSKRTKSVANIPLMFSLRKTLRLCIDVCAVMLGKAVFQAVLVLFNFPCFLYMYNNCIYFLSDEQQFIWLCHNDGCILQYMCKPGSKKHYTHVRVLLHLKLIINDRNIIYSIFHIYVGYVKFCIFLINVNV